MYSPQKAPLQTKLVPIIQNKFPQGYISTLSDSRIPITALSDMTNMDMVQDSLPRPRPSLVQYGGNALGTIIGINKFIKIISGKPMRYMISMQVISGVGTICIQNDGSSWTAIVNTSGIVYNTTSVVNFTQSNSRVYIANGTNTMSYYDINTGNIVAYNAISTPSVPTATPTGLTGSSFTYRYRISANNNVGQTAASVAATVSGQNRDTWVSGTNQVALSWTAVTGATSYNVYLGTAAGNDALLAFGITGTTYTDNNTAQPNSFATAPEADSTKGPILTNMIDSNGQLFGVGDKDNPSYLWYSGSGATSGDFSPFNGGGYVAIDYGGDSLPVGVKSFHDGKGNTAVTVITKGSAGAGKLYHVTFATQTVGDTTIIYPQVDEANGQSGTVSPNGIIEANNNLYYPTGTAFKSTGTQANVVNILVTNSISQAIETNDIPNLNLSAMTGCVGIEYQNKLYWAVPNGSTGNNEIWINDLSRNGLWILRWKVAAKFLMLYEDNTGNTHFIAVVNNQVGEFTRSVQTSDFGVAFPTRVAGGSLVFDPSGMAMASVQFQRFKTLFPKGKIYFNSYGLGEDGGVQALANTSFQQTIGPTGFDQFVFDVNVFDDEVGVIASYSAAVNVQPNEVDEVLNESKWEVLTYDANCDYTLSAVNTETYAIPELFYGDS